MKLDLAQARPMGNLIVEGTHRPFHALACALRPETVRIGRKVSRADNCTTTFFDSLKKNDLCHTLLQL